MDLQTLRFPVGKYTPVSHYDADKVQEFISNIENTPSLLKSKLQGLSESELLYLYRPEGWNVQQVVHHLVDSHINAYFRFKLALTEVNPTIKPYEEAETVLLADCTIEQLDNAVNLLEALHAKWVALLKSMKEADFKRTYHHPESKRDLDLFFVLGLYDWHCRHHIAHIDQALIYKGDFDLS